MRHAGPNELHIKTSDTTLEALLLGQVRLATWQGWPEVRPLELADPFQHETPCFQDTDEVEA